MDNTPLHIKLDWTLDYLKIQKGTTNAQIAAKIGLSREQLSRMRNNRRVTTVNELNLVLNAYNITWEVVESYQKAARGIKTTTANEPQTNYGESEITKIKMESMQKEIDSMRKEIDLLSKMLTVAFEEDKRTMRAVLSNLDEIKRISSVLRADGNRGD